MYHAQIDSLIIKKEDELDLHSESLSLLFIPGHYDILYPNEIINNLQPELRISFLIYDNDTYEIYSTNSILEEVMKKVKCTTKCCNRSCNKYIYNQICNFFKGIFL